MEQGERGRGRSPFAGEKVPTMKRRSGWHDYTQRQMYMVTLTTEGRRKLFGEVVAHSEALPGAEDAPRMVLSAFGKRVEEEFLGVTRYYPQVEVVALQMMPDHLQGILFVREEMPAGLGRLINGFKAGCNRAYREMEAAAQPPLTEPQGELRPEPQGKQQGEPQGQQQGQGKQPPQRAAAQPPLSEQQGEPQPAGGSCGCDVNGGSAAVKRDRHGEYRRPGLVFERGYNDRLLMQDGQLERWKQYLKDNPRRLLMKRERPDLFRVQRNVTAKGMVFSAIGNRFLLDSPRRLQVQCSRRLTAEEIAQQVEHFLQEGRNGAVLVSPSISPGEKEVMRAAFEAGLPLIVLQENGFTDLAKPGGQRMEACLRGQLLMLAPWEHHNERTTITRGQCVSLNEMDRRLCEGG